MASVDTRYEHVVLNDAGMPILAGTTMKVTELVVEKNAYGWSPEKLQFQHPSLSLGQIYSALAYYSDHREDLDREIERRLEQSARLQQRARPTPLVERLKAKGLL